jgi:hypothetical protein
MLCHLDRLSFAKEWRDLAPSQGAVFRRATGGLSRFLDFGARKRAFARNDKENYFSACSASCPISCMCLMKVSMSFFDCAELCGILPDFNSLLTLSMY